MGRLPGGLGRGKESEDVGPLRLVLGKMAKSLGKSGPGSETALEGTMVIPAEVTVGSTRGGFAVFASSASPIFEKFAVCEAHVEGIGLESGGANGVAPAGKESPDFMKGDSGKGEEFRAGRRTASAFGNGIDTTEKEFFVDGLMHERLRYLLIAFLAVMITRPDRPGSAD